MRRRTRSGWPAGCTFVTRLMDHTLTKGERPVTVKAAIEALRHDAGVWDRVAQVTNVAGQETQALTLTEADLSWASNYTALLGTYAEIQGKTATLLSEATTVYTGLSAALDKVADAYELSDRRAATQLGGVWDVRE